jgi:hypothetical protein
LREYWYFTEDDAYAVLFTEMVSIYYWNLIKFVKASFEKIHILYFGPCEGPQFTGQRLTLDEL